MRTISLLFLTITTITVSGQNHLLGVKGGVNWANIAADKSSNIRSDYSYKAGLAIGLTYDFLFKKHFSTGADINYNQRGGKMDGSYIDNFGRIIRGSTTLKFDYLTIPLKAGFNYGKTIYGFADIALTPSILFDAKSVTYTGVNYSGTEQTYDITSMVKKFDIGGLVEIGGGYKFKDRYWLYSSFSYQHSFTNNSVISINSEIIKLKHYGMTLNLGLKCALTKE